MKRRKFLTALLRHIPRMANIAVNQIFDRGEALIAKITLLKQSDNPWQRMQVNVYLDANATEPETSSRQTTTQDTQRYKTQTWNN